jgi:DNA-binding response OmpR family regulator
MGEANAGRRRSTRGSRRPAGLPVAEGFVLDLAARELLSDRGAVHLRPREFQLLATLAANPGRALSRHELVDLAWGRTGRVGLRSVDVHIHWLRSKIEPVPAEPTHLIAVRGFGYRLDPVPVAGVSR